MYYNISFTAEDLDRNDDTGNKGVKATPCWRDLTVTGDPPSLMR